MKTLQNAACSLRSAVLVFVLWSVALAIVPQSPGRASQEESRAPRPNVVLILVDDLGYGELGCQGNRQIPTPHIDSLARHGVRFTQGYVTASFCAPSRAGLMTGRYQTRFGHEGNPTGRYNLDPKAGLPPSERTLADQLRAAGYATGLVGKWHLGGTEEHHPMRRGFDEFYGFLHEGHFYVPPPYRNVVSFLRKRDIPPESRPYVGAGNLYHHWLNNWDEPPYDENNPILRGTRPVVEETYLTDALTREAVAFIERHKQRPFFLYLAYNAVHSPLQAADAYMDRFAQIENMHRRVFAAMLANLDDGVGAVLAKLREHDLEERTLIFFLSDNGGMTAELTSRNDPLRGGKGTMYEGGIRVPFLAQWKGRLPAGKVFDRAAISLDVFATASAAAGIELPNDRIIDGVDLLPYLDGRADGPPHETLYWRMNRVAALRHGDWKLVIQQPLDPARRRVELFDLAADLPESDDLALRRPEKLRELLARWEELNGEMVPPVWTPDR
jgi:arylsulfatase A-like enzyme